MPSSLLNDRIFGDLLAHIGNRKSSVGTITSIGTMQRNAKPHVRSWKTLRLLVEGDVCSWPLTLTLQTQFSITIFSLILARKSVFLPATLVEGRQLQADFNLVVLNGVSISTFGKHSLNLNLGLRRTFRWVFVIANVDIPIIEADFLHHYSLLVDMTNS